MFAAQNGHSCVVEILLASTSCDPYLKDNVSVSTLIFLNVVRINIVSRESAFCRMVSQPLI